MTACAREACARESGLRVADNLKTAIGAVPFLRIPLLQS